LVRAFVAESWFHNRGLEHRAVLGNFLERISSPDTRRLLLQGFPPGTIRENTTPSIISHLGISAFDPLSGRSASGSSLS
jgi:hypothetical protein